MKLIRTILCLGLLTTGAQAAKKGARETLSERRTKPVTAVDDDQPKRKFFSLGKPDPEVIAAAEAKGPVFHFPKTLEGIDFKVAAAGGIGDDPWRKLWNSAEFNRAWAGRYGFHPNIEPEITDTNELSFMRELGSIIGEDKKVAAYILSTNLTAKSNPQLDFTLGSLYFQLLDFPSAARAYQTAIDKFPDFRRAHKNLGFSYLKMGKYGEAIRPLSAAASLGDRDSTTYGLLGFCHATMEHNITAEAAYRQAILFQPDNPDWRLGLVKALVAQEKLHEANRLIEEILQQEPAAAEMWELQAGILIRMEKPQHAAANYEVIRQLNKATPAMLFSLGDLYMEQESGDLALPVYLEAIDKNGAADLARSLRTAKILVSRGSFDDAKKMFAQIRKTAGAQLQGADELTLLKTEAKVANAEGDAEGSVKTLQRVVERDPLDAEALILIGDHFLRTDELEKAEFRYDLASKVQGFEADAFVKLAQLRVKQQKYDAAIELLNKAQKLEHRDTVQRYLEAIERIRRTAGA